MGDVLTYIDIFGRDPETLVYHLRRMCRLIGIPVNENWELEAVTRLGMSYPALIGQVYDAWTLYQHAKAQNDTYLDEQAERYMNLFVYSLTRPEFWDVLSTLYKHHYRDLSSTERAKHPVIGEHSRIGNTDAWRKNLGVHKRKPTTEETEYIEKAYELLLHLSSLPEADARHLIRDHLDGVDGVNAVKIISQATNKGDTNFLITLGKAIAYEAPEVATLSLADLASRPLFKKHASKQQVTTRPWCRRYWISRALWLMDRDCFIQFPLDLSPSNISSMRITHDTPSPEKCKDQLLTSDNLIVEWNSGKELKADKSYPNKLPDWEFLTLFSPTK